MAIPIQCPFIVTAFKENSIHYYPKRLNLATIFLYFLYFIILIITLYMCLLTYLNIRLLELIITKRYINYYFPR